MTGAAPGPRYRAFISYSHRDNAAAEWLHRGLEAYRIPRQLVGADTRLGPAPARLAPIFRDRDELAASADLGREITAALDASAFLIVVCSPAAAASRWVEQEIVAFKRLRGEDRVLALIVAGEPGSADRECFPRALRFKLDSDIPAEPIAADLRPGGDGRRLAQLKLVAGLTGLRLDALVQRETQRRLRRVTAVAVAALVGMACAAALALYANAARLEANEQRRIAERESATARAASDYLVGTFALSNPATDNPRTITALTILGRSAARARTELANQPVVQSRLIAALGKALNNLGLLTEAQQAIELSLPTIRRVGVDGAEAQLTLADTYLKQGRLDAAAAMLRSGRDSLGSDLKANRSQRAFADMTEGRLWVARSDPARGLAAFDRALAQYRSVQPPQSRNLAVALANRGILLSDDGQFDAAEASLTEALAINRRTLGENHLLTGQGWFALAQNAFLAGKLPLAETRIARALAIERRMLDGDNPIIADSLSMRGQILQGQKRLPEAAAALNQAIAIYRARFGGPHYLIGIAEIYLALIESERGRTAAALRILDDAKLNYDASYGKLHANHGDLLVNRATILARAGRLAEARADCAAGLVILGKTLGPQASFTKQLTQTCAKLAA
ncbi:tetratricopeptide repeat protein [Glacieibacterium sp.]|uniref:tetratricopeptide repeat protein n=1 Tax=Glacieibacterium sp. TaxID=2860237 RepID=UPI003B00DC84